MTYFVRGKQQLLTWLPERHRRTLCLMQTARRCRVRAYLEQGVRPHINLYRVRYTNAVLACSTHLIGQPLLIYMNADDLRCVRAFLADGTELGVLEAQGAWSVKPHNLKLRQEILKLHGRKSTLGTNPIEAYVQAKLAEARKTRKAASDLAQAMRTLAAAPIVGIPPGPFASPTVAAPATTLAPDTGNEPPPSSVRPRKLTIGTGQVF
jgi:putative transposase